MRPDSSSPVVVLRAALSSPWPSLRVAARRLIRQASQAATVGDAAAALGLSRRAYERLRADFPEAFPGPNKK